MTGPAYGKVKLSDIIQVYSEDGDLLADLKGAVYLHIRGYAYAPENHLDFEARALNKIVDPKYRGRADLFYDVGGYVEVYVPALGIIIVTQLYEPDMFDAVAGVLGDSDGFSVWHLPFGGKDGGVWVELSPRYVFDEVIVAYTGIKPRG